MATYSDTFAGSGDLGVTEIGSAPWIEIAGDWLRQSGYAYTAASPSTNPIAVIDIGVGQVDLSAAVSSSGGDCLYARVTDANNWIRLRVRKWTTSSTYYTTDYEWEAAYPCPALQTGAGSQTTYQTQWSSSNTSAPSFPTSVYNSGHYGYAYSGWQNDGAQAYTNGDQYPHYHNRSGSPYLTGNTNSVPHTSSSTNYRVYLEKCVNGVVTELGNYSSSATSLRLRCDGSSIQGYVNGVSRISVTEAFNQNATKHGIGKGPSESNGSSIDNFSLDPLIPPTPYILIPANNSTIGTSTPGLSAGVNYWGGANTKIEYQIAQDAAFAVDVRSIIEPNEYYRFTGSQTTQLTEAQYLAQRGWYIRARQLSESGLPGNWTDANYFVVAHSPGATNLSPNNGDGIIMAATNNLAWLFTDTSSTDSQTAYQVIVERNDNGALVVDTGKVASADQFYALAIDAALKNVTLRWKVKVWDEEDKPSAFTNYALFIPTDAPTVTILEPLDGGSVGTSRPTVRWAFAASGGRSQASYRVTVALVGSGALLYDSGTLAGSGDDHIVQSPVIENAKDYEITVYATDSFDITVADTSTVSAVYEEPDVVLFSVDDSGYEELGYVRLTWQAENDPTFRKWRVYRRKVGTNTWTLLTEIDQLTVTEYHDWIVPAMTSYDYYVVQVVERFNAEVESVVGQTVRLDLGTGGYWLIDPVDSRNNTRLHNVTDDSYTDEHEQAEYLIVGRGRHVDEGEAIGKSGQMTVQLRDTITSTARFKKEQLEGIRAMKIPVSFRNPFGDIYVISLGNLQLDRIAGVGASEFVDVTVPYKEIF